MFQRYTEKARRVIFFARYEASQFGCSCIETEFSPLAGLFAAIDFVRMPFSKTSQMFLVLRRAADTLAG